MMKQSSAAFDAMPSPTPADDEAKLTALRAMRVAARPEGQPIPAVRQTRLVRMKRSVRLTPNMQRVTIEGDELDDFPCAQEGAHIRLMLPGHRQSEHDFVSQLAEGRRRPITRTYTVRHHRPDKNELDIDFALHPHGRACNWAMSAQPGDFVAIAGPGAKKLTDFTVDWFLLMADMTAIPAAAAALEDMPRGAVGHAVFEIASWSDRQPFDAPAGISIHWLINPRPELPNDRQLGTVKELPWFSGRPGVFVAGESSIMKAARAYLTEERGISRRGLYASAYWKIGMREDQLRALKDREAASCAS
jgi:NADPH-dependent ferric siderophore reductase